jgi:VanZ family protein
MTRHTAQVLAGVFCAIAVCGSLAPFTFRAVAWEEARARIEIPDFHRLSRFDLVDNVALFVPIGFFLMSASRASHGAAGATVRVALASALLSAALEGAQVYVPSRTPSLADFCAEQAGAAAGIVLWTRLGRDLTTWVGRVSRDRERPGPALRVLIAYVGLWSLGRLFPFNATLELHQIVQRVHDGRIVLTPFAGGDSPARLTAEAVMALPIGILATLGWTVGGIRRGAVAASAFAVVFIVAVGAAQGTIDSQWSDITRVGAGVAGALCGTAMTVALARTAARRQRSRGAT